MVCALEQIEKNRSKQRWSKNCQVLSKENFVRFRNKAVNESIHCALKLNKAFLSAEAETWDSRDSYKAAKEKVIAPHFASDCAECAMKLTTDDFNLALIHDKEQCQLTFQVENHGQNIDLPLKKLCRR